MDSGDFKHPAKKAITSTPKESFPCTKIPVLLKSPKHKKPKRQVTNNIVCSTPVIAVKRIMFGEDIQQMSPIRNLSSTSTSKSSSPIRLIDVEELENNLQVKKITPIQNEAETLVSTKKELEGSLYPFPLVNKVQVLNMVLCDSDSEIFPAKIDSKSKRGKNTVKKNVSTDDSEKITKNSSAKIVTTDKSVLENKQTIQTRSKSSANIFNKSNSENEKEKNKANARTKNKNMTSSPKSKKLKTQNENKSTEIISIENKNFGIKNDSINEPTEVIIESEKIDIKNNSAVPLRTKIDKIKKDIFNGQTKNFTNLKNRKTRNTTKEILNGAEKHETNTEVLDVSNGTKTTVVVHNSNKIENNKISPKISINTRNSNNGVENSENLNEIKNFELKRKEQTPKKRGPKPKTESKKDSNQIDSNKISPKISINTTNSNNAVEKSENLNEINNFELKRKGQTPKRRGPKPKSESKKDSNITKNSQEVRKSSRKRILSTKYWFFSEPKMNNSFEAIQNDTSKKSIKSAGKIKTNKLPTINTKSTRKTKKIQNADLPEIDKKSLRMSVGKLNTGTSQKIRHDEINSSKTTFKMQTDEISIKTLQKITHDDKISSNTPLETQNNFSIVKKKCTYPKTTNGQPKIIVHKKIELLKNTISPRESAKNKRLSIKSSKSNTPKILTAGKIRKSFKSKLSTQKKTKTRTKLEFSSKEDESYTTEEENDIPRDTLMLPTGIEGIIELPNSDKGQKRKVQSNIQLYQPKKVKVRNNDDYSFKNMALSVDVTPVKAGGLADVHIDGKRCLLGCFGKFPRHLQTAIQNSDISVGTSIQNGHITTGVIEIEPAGRKKYEYAKKVNLLFLVLGGIAEVGIGNSSQVLRLGQDFYVPKDTPYYIFNVSNTEKLVMYFSKILS